LNPPKPVFKIDEAASLFSKSRVPIETYEEFRVLLVRPPFSRNSLRLGEILEKETDGLPALGGSLTGWMKQSILVSVSAQGRTQIILHPAVNNSWNSPEGESRNSTL
jgi:hypothetical protein